MKISLLGAPGSGKGTQAKLLSEYYGIAHISTGDLFRRAISENTPLGQQIKQYMATLVPDEIVLALVKERLAQDDCKNGYILDGFPRTINQAKLFGEYTNLDKVIYLNVPKDEVVNRILSRRTCEKCGEIYNTSTFSGNKCVKCGGNLVVRKEDANIELRFDTYIKETYPLVEYYKKSNLLGEVITDTSKVKSPVDNINNTFNVIKCILGG